MDGIKSSASSLRRLGVDFLPELTLHTMSLREWYQVLFYIYNNITLFYLTIITASCTHLQTTGIIDV